MELPFNKNKSHGGTMVLWKHSLDQFVTPIQPVSQSFQPIVFHPPNSPPSLQIALYLPTCGKETEFIEEISKLRYFLEDFLENNSDHAIYIRGDSNVNVNNKIRCNIFNEFLSRFNLTSVPIDHKTYHHFLGDGLFDSSIDVILCTNHFGHEKVKDVLCKLYYPISPNGAVATASTKERIDVKQSLIWTRGGVSIVPNISAIRRW